MQFYLSSTLLLCSSLIFEGLVHSVSPSSSEVAALCTYLDGGGARCAVDERQLAEAATLTDGGHPVVVHVHLATQNTPSRCARTPGDTKRNMETLLHSKKPNSAHGECCKFLLAANTGGVIEPDSDLFP